MTIIIITTTTIIIIIIIVTIIIIAKFMKLAMLSACFEMCELFILCLYYFLLFQTKVSLCL